MPRQFVGGGEYTLSFQAAQRGNYFANPQSIRVNLQPLNIVSESVISGKTFVWCGNTICEERDSTGATTKKRFFAEGEQRVSGAGAGLYYYTRDHLGSIREVTDASGNLVTQLDYDAWGNEVVVSGNMNIDFGYAGLYFHQRSGLNLAMYRAYNPTLGRWMSRDPLENAEMSQGPNLYWYVQDDPVNRIDIFGLDFIFLNNSGAARGQGHAAALVGNDQTGWTYYSKDGITNGVQYDSLRVFNTYQGFLNDPVSQGYDRGIYFRTGLDQDLAMTTYGDAHLRDPYDFLTYNCGDFDADLAGAGDIDIPDSEIFGTTRPNSQFNALVNQGIGKVFYQLHH